MHWGTETKLFPPTELFQDFYWQSFNIVPTSKEKKYLNGSDPFHSAGKKGGIWIWEAKKVIINAGHIFFLCLESPNFLFYARHFLKNKRIAEIE